jgi:hypothetical protein
MLVQRNIQKHKGDNCNVFTVCSEVQFGVFFFVFGSIDCSDVQTLVPFSLFFETFFVHGMSLC